MNGSNGDGENQVTLLAIRQLDGVLTEDERHELVELLKADADARRAYLAHMQETASLRWIFSGHCDRQRALSLATKELHGSKHALRRGLVAALAVCASFACVAAILSSRPKETGEGQEAIAAAPKAHSVNDNVATVSAINDVHWRQGTKRPPLLSRVAIGQTFDFTGGTLELTFDTGALVKIFGPARFEVTSGKTILCHRGRATTLVGKTGKGFTIETPKARIVDLGTEFGVNISPQGDTQVVVFQGSVDLMKAGAAAAAEGAEHWTRRLVQGDAMMLSKAGVAQRLVAVQRGDFFPLALPIGLGDAATPVILDVRDNMREEESTKCYQIVHRGLQEDAPCFVDRGHQWNGLDERGLPKFLLGADYIMPFNSDKFIGDLQVDVKISRPATCYVFFDDNMSPPQWLRRDFKPTGFRLGMDSAPTIWHKDHVLAAGPARSIDFTFSIWSRDVPKRGVITLGGVDPPEAGTRSRGFNMYGIAVVAK